MTFANPIALWGLTALAIPIAIHLLSRKEGRVIRIGSIRHLTESDSRQFRSIRPNELVLFALRSLLILWVVFLIGGLRLPFGTKNHNWLLIESELEHSDAWRPLRDSLATMEFEERAFSDGFPLLNQTTPSHPVDYWTLIEKLKDNDLENVVIISHSRLSSFRGRQVTLPENVTWLTTAPAPSSFIVFAHPLQHDSILVRTGTSSQAQTSFTTSVQPAGDVATELVRSADTVEIAIVFDADLQYDAKLILASLRAIDTFVPQKIIAQEFTPKQYNPAADWIVWLSKDPAPRATERSKIITLEVVPSQNLFIQTKQRNWVLTSRLNEEVALRKNLTLSLAVVLFPGIAEKEQALAYDRRILDDRIISSASSQPDNVKPAGIQSSSDVNWLLLILVTWLAERWVALRRNQ